MTDLRHFVAPQFWRAVCSTRGQQRRGREEGNKGHIDRNETLENDDHPQFRTQSIRLFFRHVASKQTKNQAFSTPPKLPKEKGNTRPEQWRWRCSHQCPFSFFLTRSKSSPPNSRQTLFDKPLSNSRDRDTSWYGRPFSGRKRQEHER